MATVAAVAVVVGCRRSVVAVAAADGEDTAPAPAPVAVVVEAAHQSNNTPLRLPLPPPKTSADLTSAGMAGGPRKKSAGKSAKARRRLRGVVGYVVVAVAAGAKEGIVGEGL